MKLFVAFILSLYPPLCHDIKNDDQERFHGDATHFIAIHSFSLQKVRFIAPDLSVRRLRSAKSSTVVSTTNHNKERCMMCTYMVINIIIYK